MDLKIGILVLACYVCITLGSSTPEIQIFPNMNNIVGYIPEPETSVGKMKYLGKFQYTEECVKACLNNKNGRCLTFTFHTPAFEGSFSGHCYGGIEEPLWSPKPQDSINSGRIVWPCMSNMDCSLNGKCIMNKCHCRPAWGGHRCERLILRPAVRSSGYHYMEDGKNISSWGGGVLRDNNGLYHMYAAEMTKHCGINSWTLNSQLIHAVSRDPTGTYKRHDIVRTPFAHEPGVAMGPDGEFVIFWSEYHYSIPLCNCTDGSTRPGCKFPDAKFYTYMSFSKNPNGPWSTPVPVVNPNPRGGGQDTNFAPVILKDGSLFGFSRWGYWGTNGSRIHLVTASNWKDPSTYMEVQEEVWPHLPASGTEDPFMYLDGDGYFHAIFHNMYPDNFIDNCGGHSYSMDGKNWVYGGKAFDNNVVFTDGGTYSFSRRERPHFVFGADGVTPLALTNGAQYGGQYGDATYTLLQPVATD